MIKRCPISGTDESFEFLNLGDVPLVNNLCDTRQDSLDCKKFPLAVQLFTKSKLACLTESINKDKLFLNYTYQSGVNRPFLDHCTEMAMYLSNYIFYSSEQTIIDIGGNDGSLLIKFREWFPGPEYINIDASHSFIEINEKEKIKYVCQFFDENYKSDKKADLITSTNVFQHTLPIRSFVKGIYKNLKDDGIWCLEFPYLLTTLLNDNYDQVYHEHIFYYLLQNIIDLTKQEKMTVFNVSFHDIHSGTLRVLSCKNTSKFAYHVDSTINSFLNLEKTLTDEYYKLWGQRTYQKIESFTKFVYALKNQGHSIACFGAAAKGCVFLNTCKLDYNIIKFIVDDTPFKQNKFVPGTGLQVVSRDVLKTERIDYMIILAHNFKDYIINSLKGQYSGKYIIMFPDVLIV